jgi:hypothetical protein
MSGGLREPVPQAKRGAALSMRRDGRSYDEIVAALGVSKGWLSSFLTREGDPARQPVAEADDAVAAVVEEPAVAPASPLTDAETVGGELERLCADLARLRALVGGGKLSPGESIRATDTIGRITARLAVLRKEQRSVTSPERDAVVMRAGYAAADKLRRLLEEALAEAPTMADEPEGRS